MLTTTQEAMFNGQKIYLQVWKGTRVNLNEITLKHVRNSGKVSKFIQCINIPESTLKYINICEKYTLNTS